MEAIVAEIAGLMAKIERLNERQLRANQQAQAVAERTAKKQESLKNKDVSNNICMAEVGGGVYNKAWVIKESLGLRLRCWGGGGVGGDDKNGCMIKLMCKLS